MKKYNALSSPKGKAAIIAFNLVESSYCSPLLEMAKNREKAKHNVKKARIFVSKHDFKNAKEYYKKAAELFGRDKNKDKQSWVLAGAAYMSILMRDIEGGLELFEQAARLGYSDLEVIKRISKEKYKGKALCNTKPYRNIYSIVDRNAYPIGIIDWDSSSLDYWKWMGFPDYKNLRELKKHIPAYGRFNEIEKFRKFLSWVHNQFAHDPENQPKNSNPLTILKEAKSKKMFTCKEYAVLLTACLLANGHPARLIALLKEDYQYGKGKGHWVTEVWSDCKEKWILLDPQNNCYWKFGNEILNAYEIRNFVAENQIAKLNPISTKYSGKEMKKWLEYFKVLWIYRNQDFFNERNYLKDIEEISTYPHLLFQNTPRKAFKHHTMKDYLYPKMNQVSFEVEMINDGINFHLSNSLPFFKQYEYNYNNSRWVKCNEKNKHCIKKGMNKFCFRAVDIFSGVSKPITATIEKR